MIAINEELYLHSLFLIRVVICLGITLLALFENLRIWNSSKTEERRDFSEA